MSYRPNLPSVLGQRKSIYTGAVTNTHNYTRTTFNGGMPINVNHRRYPEGYRAGGPWAMWKVKDEHFPSSFGKHYPYKDSGSEYDGSFIANQHLSTWAPPVSETDVENQLNYLWQRGAEAWNRMRPDKPIFDAGLNLLELKDVPQTLKQSTKEILYRIRDARRTDRWGNRVDTRYQDRQNRYAHVAEWHLAIQFGWLPILNSYRDFDEALVKESRRLAQLLRDAGKPVRRRCTLVNDVSTTLESQTYTTGYNPSMFPAISTQSYGPGKAHRSTTSTTTDQIWASARFRYLLPTGPNPEKWFEGTLRRRLWGARVTPSTLYNLTPWSWLLDYFSSVGSLMDTLSGGVSDLLVADYFYLMRNRTWTKTTSASQQVYRDSKKSSPVTVAAERRTTWSMKTRAVGSPFGFGLSYDGLSDKQIGILGALGYSKATSGLG